MLKLNKVTKKFYTEEIETTAIDSLDLHVKEKDFLAIMGPSGCGKSTLLSVIGLLDNFDSGNMEIQGVNVTNLKEKEYAKLRNNNFGYIFQNFNLLDELSVIQNVEMPLLYRGISKKERFELASKAIEKVGLTARINHKPTQLSGGQQQRVAIARAIVANPKIILADEPTGNLDSKNGNEVMQLLKQLNDDGATILMVTHSEEHKKFAKRSLNLFDGRLV